MSGSNPKVDAFLMREERWRDEMALLRKIALSCKLAEELKWGQPCYTWEGGNIVLIHGFKEYCAFLFFKGALLKDPDGILVVQTGNVQAARQIRFTEVSGIAKLQAVLKSNGNLTPTMGAMLEGKQKMQPGRNPAYDEFVASQAGIGEKDLALAIACGDSVGLNMDMVAEAQKLVRILMTQPAATISR